MVEEEVDADGAVNGGRSCRGRSREWWKKKLQTLRRQRQREVLAASFKTVVLVVGRWWKEEGKGIFRKKKKEERKEVRKRSLREKKKNKETPVAFQPDIYRSASNYIIHRLLRALVLRCGNHFQFLASCSAVFLSIFGLRCGLFLGVHSFITSIVNLIC
ncbi:hypothetical protein V8G54_018537 [Vigna mungo]|uniref:Uncharacterized protein n=1 Tax=Vigna mungo TaxID=3915 RepID=A0AAQ3RUT7_VIGMU